MDKKSIIDFIIGNDKISSPFPVFYERLQQKTNKKVISFSLFGSKALYFLGAELNIKEAKEIYPDFICRFYCTQDVPNLNKLKELAEAGECELIIPNLKSPPIFWRILACGDKDVDICLQRDCDSIVNYREKSAVDEWLKSGKTLHFMHDCKSGHFHKIMAGMWGIRKTNKFNFLKELDSFFETKKYKPIDPLQPSKDWGSGQASYFDDQTFLSDILYNQFKDDYIEHGEENPFPEHLPMNYGSFVGDRVLATEILLEENPLEKEKIFIQSHLAIDDQMPLNGMIRNLHFLGKKIIFAVRETNLNLIKYSLSDLDNLTFEVLKGNEDGIDKYVKYYNSEEVSILAVGSGGKPIHENLSFIEKCYKQANMEVSCIKDYFRIPDSNLNDLNAQEIEILNKYKNLYNKQNKKPEEEKKDYSMLDENSILQRPPSTHQFLIDGLREMAKKYLKQNSVVVEIGSYAGESAQIFLETDNVSKIYCIDPWKNGYDDSDISSSRSPMDFVEYSFDKRIKHFKDKVVKLKMTAEEASSLIEDGSVDLVYLDGEHSHQANEAYLNLYNSKLKPDGIMSGHDWGWPGQTEAIKSFFNKDPIEVFPDNSWVYNKKEFPEPHIFNLKKNKVRIAFHTNEIGVRGSEWATYKYAHYNEKLLGNDSIYIAGPTTSQFERPESYKAFAERFKVYRYNAWSEVDDILKNENIDILYMHKGGNNDGKVSTSVKTCIHSVFQMCDPHGDKYAYISEWLSQVMGGGKYPYVPYMVDLPHETSDLRKELKIPEDAVVFGRLGGPDQFDIDFVHEAIRTVLSEREDVYFLFGFTNNFIDHPRVIYYPPFCDENFKSRFINSCDAMIHARSMGESFGLAIAEFSARNKPIITLNGGNDKAHLKMLGPKALYYNNYEEVYSILSNFKHEIWKDRDWDAYSEKYNPNAVMEKFKEVFIN